MRIAVVHSVEEMNELERQGYKLRSISYFPSNPVMNYIMGKAEA